MGQDFTATLTVSAAQDREPCAQAVLTGNRSGYSRLRSATTAALKVLWGTFYIPSRNSAWLVNRPVGRFLLRRAPAFPLHALLKGGIIHGRCDPSSASNPGVRFCRISR